MSDVATLKQLEGLLRPVYEWYECIFQVIIAVIVFFVAPHIGLSHYVQNMLLLASVGWVFLRYWQGEKIRNYQKSLNTIDAFTITPGTITHNKTETWIGKGFEFTAKHAQRVWEAEKERYKKFYALPKSYYKARDYEREVKQLLKERKITETERKTRKANFTKKAKHCIDDYIYLNTGFGNKLKEINENSNILARWYKEINKIKIKNRVAPLPPVGGKGVFHAVGFEDETDQYIDLGERNGHALCLGMSRVGKSRFLEVIITQDIQRNDGPVVLVDPKGDSELLARAWAEAKRANREDNFFVFALGFPNISCKYNAIAVFSRLTSIASRITDPMAGSGDGAVFKDFAWRFLLIVAHAMNELGEKPSFASVKRYIEDMEPLYLKYSKVFLDENVPNWKEQADRIMNPPPRQGATGMIDVRMSIPQHFKGRGRDMVARDAILEKFFQNNPDKINVTIEGLRSAMKNEQNYYNKITASLIPLLTKLTSGRIAELVSPDYSDVLDERPEISWQQIIETDSVVVVLADAMTDPMVASAVLGMMFSDLLSVCGDIYKHGHEKGLHNAKMNAVKPIWIHIDEFHSVLRGGSEGEPFQSILNRAAGAGVRCMAYTQTLSDIEDATGSPTSAGVILGNFNSTFMLRVKDEKTAEYLTQAVDKCDRYDIDVSGMTGGAGNALVDEEDIQFGKSEAGFFSSRSNASVSSEAYESIITPQMILNLPKGQAFALINGARLLKLRFPLLEEDEGFVPPDLTQMIKSMSEKYQRDDENEFTFS